MNSEEAAEAADVGSAAPARGQGGSGNLAEAKSGVPHASSNRPPSSHSHHLIHLIQHITRSTSLFDGVHSLLSNWDEGAARRRAAWPGALTLPLLDASACHRLDLLLPMQAAQSQDHSTFRTEPSYSTAQVGHNLLTASFASAQCSFRRPTGSHLDHTCCVTPALAKHQAGTGSGTLTHRCCLIMLLLALASSAVTCQGMAAVVSLTRGELACRRCQCHTGSVSSGRETESADGSQKNVTLTGIAYS